MATLEQIHELWREICALKLGGMEFARQFSYDQMRADFNGCGPEWLKQSYRNLLDAIFAEFAPAFLIHDLRFAHSDGTDESFHAANRELECNCLILADAHHAWYSPLRYWRRHQARLVYEACALFGRGAYNEAYIAQCVH